MSGFESPDKVYSLGEYDGSSRQAHSMSSYIEKLEKLANDTYNHNIPARDSTLIASTNCERREQVGCSSTWFSKWCWIRCNPDNFDDWCWTRELDERRNYKMCEEQQDNLSCGDNGCS